MAEEKVKKPTYEELQKQLDEANKKIKEGEEGALDRVSKALGVSSEEVKSAEKNAPKKEENVSYDIGKCVVTINGKIYTGRGIAPQSVVEVLVETASKKNERLLTEAVGRKFAVEMAAGGGVVTRQISGDVNNG